MTPDTTQSAGTLHVTDSRTGRSYDLPITDGAIRALDLRQIKVSGDDFGLLSYDPAFMNTASCRSAITFIDGEKGILRYRGYPVDELADSVSFLDVAYLLAGRSPPGVLFDRMGPREKAVVERAQGAWFHVGVEETCRFVQSVGWEVVNPDIGLCVRDPLILLRRPG